MLSTTPSPPNEQPRDTGLLLPWLPERAVLADPLPALRHQLQHDVERGLVVVEDHDVLAGIRQLRREGTFHQNIKQAENIKGTGLVLVHVLVLVLTSVMIMS